MKTLRGVYKVTTADQFQLQKINLELLFFYSINEKYFYVI